MTTPTLKSEYVLASLFLGLIFSVPLAQTGLELFHQERVQATDVFRARPTAKNLRQYEDTLKEKSWVQQNLRPPTQKLLFSLTGDMGVKAVPGLDDWLFYREDVRYLVEPNRVETDTLNPLWVMPARGRAQEEKAGQAGSLPHGGRAQGEQAGLPASRAETRRDSVVRAIVRFRDQLQERGITLVVTPVPGKPSVYPDQVTRRARGRELDLASPTLAVLEDLRRRGVHTVDLFAVFRQARQQSGTNQFLYLARDTHWTPWGAKTAARAVAEKIRQLGLSPSNQVAFATQTVPVKRVGDILDMTQIPGIEAAYSPEMVVCEQVRDPALGLMVSSPSDRPGAYKYPGLNTKVLVLGDSFSRIYQQPEPKSLGELVEPAKTEPSGTKRLLPGSAGFVSHLALALGAPVDSIVSDGGAATDVRRKLSTNPEILEGKKVVVWEFVERDLHSGREGWQEVALPPRMDQ